MKRGRCASEVIEAAYPISLQGVLTGGGNAPQLEPFVCLNMERIVFVAKCARGKPLLQSLRLGSSAILVCATDIERSPVACSWKVVWGFRPC